MTIRWHFGYSLYIRNGYKLQISMGYAVIGGNLYWCERYIYYIWSVEVIGVVWYDYDLLMGLRFQFNVLGHG